VHFLKSLFRIRLPCQITLTAKNFAQNPTATEPRDLKLEVGYDGYNLFSVGGRNYEKVDFHFFVLRIF
jgi:hypothetical protein